MLSSTENFVAPGRPPFEIMYNIAQDADGGGTRLLDQPTFNSIQHRTRFQLHTSSPGRVYYEVKQIGDTSYPLKEHRNAIIPRSSRLLFEQQVSARPSARFKNRNRLSYCLNDAFVPTDIFSPDGIVLLEGTPPFQVTLSIKNLISSTADKKIIETNERVWRMTVPSYEFKSIGPHHVKIESISDSSGCDHGPLDPLENSIWIDVAETAAIIPFDRKEDYCVGEIAQFQLEGIPPWTIGYVVYYFCVHILQHCNFLSSGIV
jgi:nucleoporin POM152